MTTRVMKTTCDPLATLVPGRFACVAMLMLVVLSARAGAQAPAQARPAASAAPAPPAPAIPSRVAPADRLPPGCNAVMLVDVARLADSPWGKQNDLRNKLNAKYGARPLPVPGNARRVAVGGKLLPVGLDSLWRAAVIELPAAPRLEPMIQAQGGYLDKVGNKPAAWSPKGAFYVALDGNALGVYQPADRRQVLTWALSPLVTAPLPPYVTRALTAAPPEAVATFAMDLQESISPAAISYALSMGELPSIESMETDKLLPALASVTGTTITIRPAGETLEAEWAIDFAQDVSALGAFANALVIDALKSAGAYEPEVEQWAFKAEGKRFVGKRAINEESFTRLISLLAPPSGGAADAAGGGEGDAQPAGGKAKSAAEASQAYYRAVAKSIDVLGPKASASQSGTSLTAQANRIQQLPVLDVDPALVEWGGSVAETLSRAAHEISIGGQRAQAAAAAVASPAASSAGNYGSASTPESRAAFRNAANQRRQAAQTERASAAQRALEVLNTIPEGRAKVRADMSQKYRVEF